MRRWLIRSLALATLLALVVALRLTVFAPEPMRVEVATVERGRVEETITNSRAGTVKARRRAKLSPEIGGTVVELPYREGDAVNAGDVVLRLDDSLQRARLGVARRELESASAERRRTCLAAERSARELRRLRGLTDDGIISTDRLDQAESAAEINAAACLAAGAGEERARSQVALAEAELAKTVLRAPFDGIVAEVATEVGEYGTPAPPGVPMPPVLDLLDPGTLYVSAPMDEVDSARIRAGQEVQVTIDSHRGREIAGRVVRVAPYVLDVQEQNRTVEIEVELEDADIAGELLPGTSADVEVILEAKDDVLRIPTPALIDGDRVLLLDGGRLRSVAVETGLRNWDHTEIVGGLEAGVRIVSVLDRPEIRAGAEARAARDGEPP